ncbi:FG-GAP-like repeat-containing protein [Streptomyces sp. NPDC002688]|uniref:FG-GAP-like repeat-containing protein n=1 Tax=Streptomyces sp. NPDC002688 TaxID=3154423 RepID=UPI003317FDC2
MRNRTLLLAAALATGLLTTPAAAAPSRLSGDFNGDGYRDVVVGAAGTTVGSAQLAGAVVVLYGSSSPVSAARKTVITQNSAGVPGTAESYDSFGSSLAVGDLDGDGYADIVVGSPNESIGDRDGVGSATVLWGGKSGLSGGATLPQPSTLAEWGGFASGAATGDFDGDGRTDVTLSGQDRTRLYTGPFTRTGTPASHTTIGELGSAYNVIAGDLTGDGAAERLYPFGVDGDEGGAVSYFRWTGTRYVRTTLPSADGFQGSVGDINGDGYGDLVLGDHEDPHGVKTVGHKGGQIYVWYGSATGPDPSQAPTVVNQDTPGVPGAGEDSDIFGSAISTGDINGDGYADVAVGTSGEDVGRTQDAGGVTILLGSASGLTTKGAEAYTQDTAGVPGTAETSDAFGQSVRLADLDKNGKADLVVGSGGENGYGAVTVLRGSATGLTTTGATSLTARDVSLKGGASFGWAIAQ